MAVTEHVRFPGVEVTVYPVIGVELVAGSHVTVAVDPIVKALIPETCAGGPACGVTVIDALGLETTPPELAVTVMVYVVPFVRPVMTHDVEAVWQEYPPGSAIATYPSAPSTPPHDTDADESPPIAVTLPGAEGAVEPACGCRANDDGVEAPELEIRGDAPTAARGNMDVTSTAATSEERPNFITSPSVR